jgi:hypothetical protein
LLVRGTRRLLAATLVLALNSYGSASAALGTVYATGHVEVDGTYVPESMVVMSGQGVRTTGNSKALLQLHQMHTTVLAFENTAFKLNNNRIVTLLGGGLSVDTAQQARTNIGSCAWVMPWSKEDTKYEIQLKGTTAIVRAYQRPVTLRTDFYAIELQPNTVGVVENYNSPKCKVAFYQPPSQLTPELRTLLYQSYVAAATVPFWFPRQEMSSQAPVLNITPAP